MSNTKAPVVGLWLVGLSTSLWLLPAAPTSAQSTDPFAVSGELPAPSVNAPLTPGTLDRLHGAILRSDLTLLGAQSCAAASCHGGPRPGVANVRAERGSEYPLWLENDPHARSWQTISSPQSVDMMRRLNIMQDNAVIDQAGFDNCLACHNTTRRFDEPRTHVQRSEGVGCAGCHGPEQLWAQSHYQWGFDAFASADIGFVPNGDLLARARMCASCHVGDQDRDMNHDLIAAGHPPLRFELATYHAWQPKHWRDAESADRTFYEAQLWLAGQIAAADAALALLQTRTGPRQASSPWPEFSAYDCSSCHHALGLNTARRTPQADSVIAVAPLSHWNFAGLQWVIEDVIDRGVATEDDLRLLGTLARVREEMESAAVPDPQRTHAAALEARRAIDAWVRGSGGSMQPRFRSDTLGRIAAHASGKAASFDTWEATVQLYLALVAARESWPGGWSGPLQPLSEQLRRGLRYPEMVNTPAFELSGPPGPTATRAGARQLTLQIAKYLGPITLDGTRLPGEEDPAPHTLQFELESALEEAAGRWQQQRGERGAVPRVDPGRREPPADPPDAAPLRRPEPEQPRAPRITPEELRRRLQELEQN